MTDTLSPELLACYADARMPRYTSYPTAPNSKRARLEPLIADGLIERDGAEIAVRPHARPLVRSIAAAFDAHLAATADKFGRAV